MSDPPHMPPSHKRILRANGIVATSLTLDPRVPPTARSATTVQCIGRRRRMFAGQSNFRTIRSTWLFPKSDSDTAKAARFPVLPEALTPRGFQW